jgi:hypothetical protein
VHVGFARTPAREHAQTLLQPSISGGVAWWYARPLPIPAERLRRTEPIALRLTFNPFDMEERK